MRTALTRDDYQPRLGRALLPVGKVLPLGRAGAAAQPGMPGFLRTAPAPATDEARIDPGTAIGSATSPRLDVFRLLLALLGLSLYLGVPAAAIAYLGSQLLG